MKYIVMQVAGPDSTIVREIPFIFPEIVVHSDMSKAMKVMLRQQFKHPKQITCIAAGFFSSVDIITMCYGESTSLDLKSRGEEDMDLINMCDYGSMNK